MRVSWREVLGLLIGLGMCYAVISYALVYAPQLREMASEPSADPRRSETDQRTEPDTTDGEKKTMTIRITGATGEEFGANLGSLRTSRTVEGTTPEDYEVEVSTDLASGDHISATAWKITGNRKELKVQLLDNGKVLQETSTTKDYGATGVRWSPGDPQPETTMPGTTTPGKEKTGEETKLKYKAKGETTARS